MAQKRRMTAQEKAERERVRKKLREEGLLPPKKKPLDRRAFVKKAKEVLEDGRLASYEVYFYWALMEILEKSDPNKGPNSVSAEAVGAAKVILLAERRMVFTKENAGRTYTNRELLDALVEIYNA